MNSDIKDLTVCIVTHVYATGPPQDLNDYLKNKAKKVMFIGHPFSFSKDTRSFYAITNNGQLIIEKKARKLNLPEYSLYIKDAIYSFLWVIQSKTIYDVYVGVDPLNALVGIFLKKMKRVRRVVFYTIDYVPHRFNNPIFNSCYHLIDSFCTNNCDKVWNLSPQMEKERQKKGVFTKNQIVVPVGVHFKRINRLSIEKVNRKNLIYMGHLSKVQGLQLIMDVMPDLVKKIPDIKLTLIGGGELDGYIRDKVKQFGIEKNIEIKGFIEDHKDLEEIMTHGAIGLAIYEPSPDSFTYFTDPSKPKQYMACGLPIITTHVPWISEDVKRKRLGQVIDYNKQDLIRSICDMIERDKDYIEYRGNAINYASNLEWEKIFSSAIQQSD